MLKVCTICGEEKPFFDFRRDSQKSCGRRSNCSVCERKKEKERYQNRVCVPRPVEGTKVCATCGEEKHVDGFYSSDTSTDGLLYDCKICSSARNAQGYQRNREKRKESVRRYAQTPKARERIAANFRRKRKEDPQFNIASKLRSRLLKALNGVRKPASAVKELGCSLMELERYLESLFYDHPETGEPMTWDGEGTLWSIDHWIPLRAFDLADPQQFREASRWSNLRPMWQSTNCRKRHTHPDDLPDDIRAEIPDCFWEDQSLRFEEVA